MNRGDGGKRGSGGERGRGGESMERGDGGERGSGEGIGAAEEREGRRSVSPLLARRQSFPVEAGREPATGGQRVCRRWRVATQ